MAGLSASCASCLFTNRAVHRSSSSCGGGGVSLLTAHRSRSLQLVDLAVKEGKNRIKPDGLVYSAGSAR